MASPMTCTGDSDQGVVFTSLMAATSSEFQGSESIGSPNPRETLDADGAALLFGLGRAGQA
jgi:hypothetical protein